MSSTGYEQLSSSLLDDADGKVDGGAISLRTWTTQGGSPELTPHDPADALTFRVRLDFAAAALLIPERPHHTGQPLVNEEDTAQAWQMFNPEGVSSFVPSPKLASALLGAGGASVSRHAFAQALEERARSALSLSPGQRLHLVLSEPATCRLARWISAFVMATIVLSILSLICESMPCFQSQRAGQHHEPQASEVINPLY